MQIPFITSTTVMYQMHMAPRIEQINPDFHTLDRFRRNAFIYSEYDCFRPKANIPFIDQDPSQTVADCHPDQPPPFRAFATAYQSVAD